MKVGKICFQSDILCDFFHCKNITRNTNPILPAPGVCRSNTTNAEAGISVNIGRHYDNAVLNRRRRGVTLEDGSKAALLPGGSFLKMGTFNANALRTEYKVAECEQRRNDASIEILGGPRAPHHPTRPHQHRVQDDWV